MIFFWHCLLLFRIRQKLQVIQLIKWFGPFLRRLQLNWHSMEYKYVIFLYPSLFSNNKIMYSNWGTESDPEFKGYHNGNSEPRGFGMWYFISFNLVQVLTLNLITVWVCYPKYMLNHWPLFLPPYIVAMFRSLFDALS